MNCSFTKFPGIDLQKVMGTGIDFSQYYGLFFKKELEKNKEGLSLGEINLSEGRVFRILLHGVTSVMNAKGEFISTHNELSTFIEKNLDDELNHEALSYIEVSGKIQSEDKNATKKFVGIFYSLSDAVAHMTNVENDNVENEVLSVEVAG